MYNNIGLGVEPTAWRHAPVIWKLAKWNSVKWNETRRIGAIFACFRVARVCQRQLGFLVNLYSSKWALALNVCFSSFFVSGYMCKIKLTILRYFSPRWTLVSYHIEQCTTLLTCCSTAGFMIDVLKEVWGHSKMTDTSFCRQIPWHNPLLLSQHFNKQLVFLA